MTKRTIDEQVPVPEAAAAGQPVPVLYFMVPSRRQFALVDTYWRTYVPGTYRKYARGHHYGIDIPGPVGTLICPGVGGMVRNPHWGVAYGNQAIVVPGRSGGLFFGHFRYPCPVIGKTVTRTKTFAQMDTTGQVTGSHTHVEWHPVWYDWWSVADPYQQIESARRAMLAPKLRGAKRDAAAEAETALPKMTVFELHEAPEGPTKDDVDAMLEENHDWFDSADPWHRDNVRNIRRRARAA